MAKVVPLLALLLLVSAAAALRPNVSHPRWLALNQLAT
jgi:hypothetical protein